MTITVNDTRNEYTATASQAVFNYTFKIFESTDLNVYQTPAGQTPADTDIITGYTVVGEGLSAGGSITLNTVATVGDLITIVSDIPESRTTDYQVNGDFVPETVNNDFDRVVSLAKQSQSIISRTPQFPEATQGATGLTWDAPEVGMFVRWKSDLTGLENIFLNTAVGADNAAAISYDNSTSGLTGVDVQAVIDEIQYGNFTFGDKTGTVGSELKWYSDSGVADNPVWSILTDDLVKQIGGIATSGVWSGQVVGGMYIGRNAQGTQLFDFNVAGTTSGIASMLALGTVGTYQGNVSAMTDKATATFIEVLQWNDTEINAVIPITNPTYTVATLPSAAIAGQTIFVSDETGGAVMAFSDATNWRRCTDRAVVS